MFEGFFLGKKSADCIDLGLFDTLGSGPATRPFVVPVTANDGSDSEGVCWDDLCVLV